MSAAHALRRRSLHWTVFADTATVGVLTAVAKAAGAVKVIVMARYFGTSDALDAFLIAFLLPAFFADVIAGCYTPSVVPAFVRTRAAQGEDSVRRLSQVSLSFGVGIMVVMAILLAFTGQWLLPLLGFSFSPAKLAVTEHLYLWLLLWLPLAACIANWRGVLNSEGVFGYPAIVPLATPVISIVLLYAAAPRFGVDVLCAGTLAGTAVECAALAIAVKGRGYPILPAWDGWTPEIAAILKQYGPLTAGAIMTSACVIVDQSVAGTLGSGSVSALVYGNKLIAVFLAIVATAIGTAVLPVFSRLVTQNDWVRLRRSLFLNTAGVLLCSIPVTVALIVWSEPVVRLMLERGAFNPSNTALVANIQRFALLQAPFSVVLALVMRLAVAVNANALLARVAILSFAANLLLDLLLARWMGIVGIALSTALVQMISLTVLWTLLRRREPRLVG